MTARDTSVLVSGAGPAGSVLAYWLQQHGFQPTVVERAPGLRRTGGHAVDLWGAAVDIVERMGLLHRVEAQRTQIGRVSFVREGKPPIGIDRSLIGEAAIPGRHIEIMRDDLTEILYEGTRDRVEYVFGDSVTALEEHDDGVHVTFEHGAERDFGVVVGADGLHSGVRRLAFGPESGFRRYLGGYLSVCTGPNELGLDGEMLLYNLPGKLVVTYPVRGGDRARVLFVFRQAEELDVDHRDTERQRHLLRAAFADAGWEVPRLLAQLDGAADFYFDPISQIRTDDWARGRVALVGDAGYSPGPAVGGGTTLAVVCAYVLAGELAAAGGDHAVGLPAYENEIRDVVLRSRHIGPAGMRTLTPRTSAEVWLGTRLVRLLPRLPRRVRQANSGFPPAVVDGLTAVSRFPLKDYLPVD